MSKSTKKEIWAVWNTEQNEPVPPSDSSPHHDQGMLAYWSEEAAVAAAKYQEEHYNSLQGIVAAKRIVVRNGPRSNDMRECVDCGDQFKTSKYLCCRRCLAARIQWSEDRIRELLSELSTFYAEQESRNQKTHTGR